MFMSAQGVLILNGSNLYMGLAGYTIFMFSSYLPDRDKVSMKNYRYVTFYLMGPQKLRKNIRRRIPDGVLRKICEKYPDGIYVGFKEGKVVGKSMTCWAVKEHDGNNEEK